MRDLACRTDLPVLMLFDVDPLWPQNSIRERLAEVQCLIDALIEIGHPVTRAILETNDLDALLQQVDPEEITVFNCCDDIPGISHGCALVAHKLEMLGFIYTGADSKALDLGQDKRKIKRRLELARIFTPIWEVFTSARTKTWKHFSAIVKPEEELWFKSARHAAIVDRFSYNMPLSGERQVLFFIFSRSSRFFSASQTNAPFLQGQHLR